MAFYFDQNRALRLTEFDQWRWLVYGFSTRSAGNLGLSAGNSPEQARQKQLQFLDALGGRGMRLTTLRQVHSAIVRTPAKTSALQAGDALIVKKPRAAVGVKTADCLPVLVVDRRRRAVAAIHAGWRGMAQRIVEKSVGEMRHAFRSRPEDLCAAIGPGIQACCFEVGPEVLAEFASQFVDADRFCHPDPPNPALTIIPRQVMTGKNNALMRDLDSDRGRVDLAEAARLQLLAAGVPAEQIYNSGLCTVCDAKRFYSHRREKEAAGRMLAVIGVKPAKRSGSAGAASQRGAAATKMKKR